MKIQMWGNFPEYSPRSEKSKREMQVGDVSAVVYV